MGTKAWPKVKRTATGWLVDSGRVLPARTRKRVATKEALNVLLQALQSERKALKSTARFERGNRVVSLTGLDDAARRDVLGALDVLAGRGSLTDAATFYVAHYAPAKAMSLPSLMDGYLESLRASNRRPRTLRDAENKTRGFVEGFRNQSVQSITQPDVERWLANEGKRRKWGPNSRNAYRRALLGMFNYAVSRELIQRNPAAHVATAAVDGSMPSILTVREVRRLLGAVRRVDPQLLPYAVLGIFCGLRPENELGGLDWKDIDLDRKIVLVRPASAKKRRMRYVDLADNAIGFLRPFSVEEGQVYYSRVKFRRAVELARLIWTRDVMRHTFASYHLVQHENAGATALQLGHHGDTTVLFSHYRNLVRREEAAAFWNLRPLAGNVIKLPRAVA